MKYFIISFLILATNIKLANAENNNNDASNSYEYSQTSIKNKLEALKTNSNTDDIIEIINIGKKLEIMGDDILATECFETVAVYGKNHIAYRFLAAEAAINLVLSMGSNSYYRASNLLELEVSLAPELLAKTPKNINNEGSKINILACCPDILRAEIMVKTQNYYLAIPLLENIISNYDDTLGRLDKKTLLNTGIEENEIYVWLILCYVDNIKNNNYDRNKNENNYENIYKILLKYIENSNKDNGLDSRIVDNIPVLLNIFKGPDGIKKIEQIIQVAGLSRAKMLMILLVYPDEEARKLNTTGEEMDIAYKQYLCLVENCFENESKKEYLVDFNFSRLRNAMRKAKNRELADLIIKDIIEIFPLSEDQMITFSSLQIEYVNTFLDGKIKDLPFAEIAVAAKKLLPKQENGLNENGTIKNNLSGNNVNNYINDSNFTKQTYIWVIVFFIGMLIVFIAYIIRKHK